jgi:nitronate monooxygenase
MLVRPAGTDLWRGDASEGLSEGLARMRRMWSANAFTERLNLKWPILQAPMGSASTPALAAAVSNAGGLGGLGMWGRSADHAARRIAGFRQQSGGGLNVNYPVWPDPRYAPEASTAMRQHLQVQYDAHGFGRVPQPTGEVSDVGPEHVALLLETKPEVVSFHFGLPEPEVIRALKSAGIFILSSATTVGEARLLELRGVDAIIAQGTEAGGHRATFTGVDNSSQPGLFSLLPQVVDAVRVPVIAAGGVADGRTSAAAFMLGAVPCRSVPPFCVVRKPMCVTRIAPPSPRRTTPALSSPT